MHINFLSAFGFQKEGIQMVITIYFSIWFQKEGNSNGNNKYLVFEKKESKWNTYLVFERKESKMAIINN